MFKRAQLATFCMVVESESLTAAAERLFCVPSNVTKKLKELEMACGVTLFERERNRLSLTPEGRALYHKAKRFLAIEERARAQLEQDPVQGELRLGALDIALSHHLPQKLAHYRAQNRRVQLSVVQGYSLDLEFQLQKGALDVVFSDGPIEHPQMQSRRAFQERLVFIGGACRPALLAKSDLYVYSRQCHYRHLVEAWLQKQQVIPAALLEVECYDVIFACVTAGLGYAFVPESLARQRKVAYIECGNEMRSDIYAIWRKASDSRILHDFIDAVIRH
ncbi:LysR family transcriptional regulator [Serratia marcescens]|uniref:LysR family transcriptional regulator n=1 Tax=Serratia marcescens TaxID=615 RepID=UPI003208A92A